MDVNFLNSVRSRIERVRAARQFADQRIQRATMLITQANLLFARFDELELRALLRTAAAKRQKPARTL